MEFQHGIFPSHLITEVMPLRVTSNQGMQYSVHFSSG